MNRVFLIGGLGVLMVLLGALAHAGPELVQGPPRNSAPNGIDMGGDLTMGAGTQIFLDDGDATDPALAVGLGVTDTGFFKGGPNSIYSTHAGVAKWEFGQTRMGALGATAGIITTVMTATAPGFANRSDTNTGLGWATTDTGTIIGGGVIALRWSESTDTLVEILGGFTTEPVTADPCGDTTNFPIGAIFFNSTSNYHCFCGAANADLKMNDNTTACF